MDLGRSVWGFRLRGGGYLGIGIGEEGEGVGDEVASFWGGFDGREEKRLRPGSEASTGIEKMWTSLFQFLQIHERWITSASSISK